MPKTHTITANYRDRSSPFKWLVRDTDAHPTTAIACKAVNAERVRFTSSNHYEEGFGCKIVALAESVEIISREPIVETFPVVFTGHGFARETTDGPALHTLTALKLASDGSMLGTL